MDHFTYRSGRLHCEDVPAATIAAAVGTPCYVYSRATMLGHFQRLQEAFASLKPLICYSIKSCGNIAICRTLARQGAGMDLVSGGELHRAMLAGVAPADCVYAGVGKTDEEICMALRAGVGWLNVESEAEFENIAVIARREGIACQAALRVNPDVDPSTHRYTTTGKKESKFGVDLERAREFFQRYGRDAHCRLRGLHMHIGSPVYSIQPYVDATMKLLALIDELQGRGFAIEMLDLGGGFGADYVSEQSPLARDYAERIVPLLEQRVRDGLQIILEPGRTIIANAGILLLRVLYMKTSGDKTFVICDGGMNVLLRPSHYGSFHFIWPCGVAEAMVPARRSERLELPGLIPMDVVGPICETGDFLALDRPLPPLQRGDLLAVFSAGAYGMAMASHYNSMPLPAEVMVEGSAWSVIRQRETYGDLTRMEEAAASIDAAAMVE